ncbi:NAD(P)/FAD-dependent oxidoreductase [Chelatococcus asaccharovorans]|uniref:NADPH-dependent 2,4-dienoyl-CoA reductase/sulfur reductase-like enzyme n=1 Tax=Chelatococcus asaccharovorans TaxID=28210 RepID=A0A2V3TRW5_9HYPH|nr:FAD/NAD(P)-binding oxidoreductase [Chelatococcus asaccharovorans]MBS7707848.1 NAD(P)/FAD-dependent oxidoreductase [Chelatococcus asaccharovorans]PXW50906.1 NADPH-dependent 2,4-dienoyl-CoA reductase/sulfur reductase-like enzyme [Chelatococcus asaccharovorans]
MTNPILAVIGAGPAGIRAACTLAKAGYRPVVITEAADIGGQIYRKLPTNFKRPPDQLYGSEAKKALSLFSEFDRARSQVDLQTETLAWNIFNNRIDMSTASRRGHLHFDKLILCTGAMDRIAPIPGWTTPGVFTLGGAQIALKSQGVAVGTKVAFVGTGPLLYLVASQYQDAGIEVSAVLDTTPLRHVAGKILGLLAGLSTTARGIGYIGRLLRAGTRILTGITPTEIVGETRVSNFRYLNGGEALSVECDAVAMGFGLKAETQLADLAGCEFHFDHDARQWLPTIDDHGRSSRPDVYLAGDGSRIGGADVAELTGERAAISVLQDLGHRDFEDRARLIDRVLRRSWRFRQALDKAYPYPDTVAEWVKDDTIVCRCERIEAGELRRSVDELSVREVNRAKAFVRSGMGRCQGRLCGLAGAEILAGRIHCPVEEVGRLRSQPPVKPISVSTEQN